MVERYVLQVYVGSLSRLYEALSIESSKTTSAAEIVECICEKLGLSEGPGFYELAEVMGNQGGQDCKERRIGSEEYPVALHLLWPKKTDKSTGGHTDFKFCLRRKQISNLWSLSNDSNDSQLIRDYFLRFLFQPRNCEYPDLCQLPDLTEQTLLENLKARFEKGHIYTYVGSILIAVNPFTFYPIYNPKYVQLYQNRPLGNLPPHIFAIADAAYQSMLRKRTNQCIVISGESGSGKTESTNLLLHHLTALSQKGTHGSGVEQTILGAGPVLEAFGNAKTKFNNNSSRFGKFIQVNYKENGAVHGALVQKYLLEKSRIVSQVKNERNYHVFYYLLDGLPQEDKDKLYLTKPQDYFYLNQSKCYTLEGVDERHEFLRLTQSMEMVGFSKEKQFLCFQVLSAVLHLGNVHFSKKSTYHSDETVMVKNPEVVTIISKLLDVKEETLTAALTCKRTKAAKGEMLVINYKLPDAIATRDAMAKCLYGALFDWIVMQVNHALLWKKDPREHKGNSIGVLDIFGFEDFAEHNNFEQFCINYANERLQYYFNQHVFKYEQEEYQREGISWRNIDFNDNTECLKLIEDKPDGLLYLLDDQCNFPCGNNETILQKFIYHHKSNPLFEVPPCRDSAFAIKHYAGKVKYKIRNFREKNLDLMRPDIVSVLKLTQMAFVRELVCSDPLALFRWHILRAFFKGYYIFSKLRELSRVKRGLVDTHLFNELSSFSVKYEFRHFQHRADLDTLSRTLPDKHTNLHQTSSSSSTRSNTSEKDVMLNSGVEYDQSTTTDSSQPTSSSLSQPISKALLSRQTPYTSGSMFHSPQCVHGALMRTASTNFSCPVHGSQAHLCSTEARVLSRANKILMKKYRYPTVVLYTSRSNRNFKLLKQLLGPPSTSSTTTSSSKHAISIPRSTRKQTPTVTHQFQQSLQQLMDTLSHANPFFVRCIKSNAEKMPNHFDDRLVLMQLRYTGMLETVRIRQSGYSVRLTFDEFIQHYRILLPRGLVSSKMDVKVFLQNMNLKPDMYQIGITKIFMRESEKLSLDEQLHQQILKRIITLQRWVRTWISRKSFKEMREAAIVIQTYTRRYIAQRRLSQLKRIAQYENWAANCIQKHWRSYQTRKWFTNLRHTVVNFQAACRGYLTRSKVDNITREISKQRQEATAQAAKMSGVSVSIRTTPPISLSQDFLPDSHSAPIASSSSYQSSSSSILPSVSAKTTCSDIIRDNQHSTVNIHSVSCNDNNGDRKWLQNTESLSSSSLMPSVSVGHTSYEQSKQALKEYDILSSERKENISISFKQTAHEDDYDLDDDFINDVQVRLNRKRNIPIRKTSFKRKANKSLSDDKLLTISDSNELSSTSTTNLSDNHHRQLTKLSSDSNVLCASMSSFVSSGYDTNNDSVSSLQKLQQPSIENVPCHSAFGSQQQNQFYQSTSANLNNQNRYIKNFPQDESQSSVGAIQKAKATFRNIIGKSNQETNKRLLKQSISVKSGLEFDSHNENIYSLTNNKSLSNIDLGCDASSNYYSYSSHSPTSQHDIQSHTSTISTQSNNQSMSTKSISSQDGNFSLLSKHSTKHESGFKSGEICAICENSMLILSNPSHSHFKCTECKQLFHRKCIHLCSDIPCIKEGSKISSNSPSVLSALNPPRPPRNKQKNLKLQSKFNLSKENKGSSATLISHSMLNDSASMPSETLTVSSSTADPKSVRIIQFTDPHDILITDLAELQIMDKFISKKIREIDDVKKKAKESMVDVVFKRALREFKSNLISTYSVSNQDGYFRLTYKDLIVHFEQILLNVCQKENTYKSFPVIIGVNAFRGYMDELRKMHIKNRDDKLNGHGSKKSYKRKQSKKSRGRNKKEDEVFTSYEHVFILSMANIYTVCEVCNSIMWLMEKIWVCRCCKLTSHRKCVEKVNWTCGDDTKSLNKVVFGAPLTSLISDEFRIPLVVEQLITKIELKGLYTEGIYRKSGASSKINELKQLFDLHVPDIDLDQYSVHVLAGALKSFFRDMPEPLMTFELYDDFLWATTISDPIEKVQVILNHISKLPKQNYDLLERLTFHLARVAQQETANRMNPNSLAIVFAPCILRTNKKMQLQENLNDIGKQTICIQSIISERMKQISDTLKDIDILDTACHTASSRLSSLRHSKLNLNRESLTRTTSNVDDEEALLTRHINELITEKNHLTNILPTFQMSGCSDDDMLCSNEDNVNINASSDECLSTLTPNLTISSKSERRVTNEKNSNYQTSKSMTVLQHKYK